MGVGRRFIVDVRACENKRLRGQRINCTIFVHTHNTQREMDSMAPTHTHTQPVLCVGARGLDRWDELFFVYE